MTNNRYKATGLGVRPKRESSIRHAERTILGHKGVWLEPQLTDYAT